ncbi:hypothetical protein PsorP6_011783 [Peronosclerospora sorghi]|uniref:Uncharacterized protein n=1 Tax=Peronosclerospora sorghi TaxID=230839 RepID=A0ACC0WIQ0_9STRA|nr:hypothetical protein PsorP6_011783 [Peronosclerospora sorghi]
MRKALKIDRCRASITRGKLRACFSQCTLPKGYKSPQAVADAVAAALEAETDTAKESHDRVPAATAKLVRRRLEGDVMTTERITAQQLMFPKETPDWQLIKPEHFEKVPIPKDWTSRIHELQQRIGIVFHDIALLKSALTHHGCLPNNPLPDDIPAVRLSNRSLEFLGDSLLGAAAAGYVYQMLPAYQEGQLSRAKSAIVNNETLSKISADLGITKLVLWPPGLHEASSAPVIVRGRTTIAAGAVESLIAAIYLDQNSCEDENDDYGFQGLEAALHFIATHILPRSVEYATREFIWEPVVELQNLLQGHSFGHPVYKYVLECRNDGTS